MRLRSCALPLRGLSGSFRGADSCLQGRAQGAGQDEAAERVKRTRNNALHRRTSGRTGPCCERESDKRHQKTRARSHRLQVHDATSSHPPSKDARAALLAEAARLGAVLVQGGVGAEDVAIVLREELHGVQVGAALPGTKTAMTEHCVVSTAALPPLTPSMQRRTSFATLSRDHVRPPSADLYKLPLPPPACSAATCDNDSQRPQTPLGGSPLRTASGK
eukprot:scaffold31_cov312-Prasinococcus_capsulatus_cf.AAC.4